METDLKPNSRHSSEIQIKETETNSEGEEQEYWRNIYPFNIETNSYELVEETNRELYYEVELKVTRSELGKKFNEVRTTYENIIDSDQFKVNHGETREEKINTLETADYDFCFDCLIKEVEGGEIVGGVETEWGLHDNEKVVLSFPVKVDKPPTNSWENAGVRVRFGRLSVSWTLETTISNNLDPIGSSEWDNSNSKLFTAGNEGFGNSMYVHEYGTWDQINSTSLQAHATKIDIKNDNYIAMPERAGFEILNYSDLSTEFNISSSDVYTDCSWNDSYLAMANDSSVQIEIYNIDTWTHETNVGTGNNNTSCSFSNNQNWLAYDGTFDEVVVLSTSDWSEVASITNGSSGNKFFLEFSHDNNYLATAGYAGPIKIINTNNWSVEQEISLNVSDISGYISWSYDNRFISATYPNDNKIYIISTDTWNIVNVAENNVHGDGYDDTAAVSWSKDNNYLALNGSDSDTATLEIFQLPSSSLSTTPNLPSTSSSSPDPSILRTLTLAESNISNEAYNLNINLSEVGIDINSINMSTTAIDIDKVTKATRLVAFGLFKDNMSDKVVFNDKLKDEVLF